MPILSVAQEIKTSSIVGAGMMEKCGKVDPQPHIFWHWVEPLTKRVATPYDLAMHPLYPEPFV